VWAQDPGPLYMSGAGLDAVLGDPGAGQGLPRMSWCGKSRQYPWEALRAPSWSPKKMRVLQIDVGQAWRQGGNKGLDFPPPAFRGFQVRAVAPACPGSSLVPRSLGKTWGHGSSCSLTAGGLNWGSFRSETRLCLSTDPWILNLPFPRGPA
jgi:hypothetical protein